MPPGGAARFAAWLGCWHGCTGKQLAALQQLCRCCALLLLLPGLGLRALVLVLLLGWELLVVVLVVVVVVLLLLLLG